MLIPTKKRCKKKHVVIGGAGIFDTLWKGIASVAKTALGKKAIEAGKTVVKEVGLKAIDVGKDLVIAKANAMLTQKSKDTLASLINNSSGGAISIQDLVKRLNTGSGLRLA